MQPFNAAALTLMLPLAFSGTVHCAEFPARPARIVVPIGAGSSMDIVARVLAQKLTEAWGQTVIVDNRAGAGGILGTDLVAKAAPDGCTILFASSSLSIGPSFFRNLPYKSGPQAVNDLPNSRRVST